MPGQWDNGVVVGIYEYMDYRSWLRDYFEQRKRTHPHFSYRFMAGRLDMDPASLVKILQGKLHLSTQHVPGVCKFCALDARAADYFETLVLFSKSKGVRESHVLFQKLMSIKGGIGGRSLSGQQQQFYAQWYHSAIRALVGIGIPPVPEEIAKWLTPTLPLEQIRASLDLLIEIDLIRQEGDRWIATDAVVTTAGEWGVELVRQYQKDVILLGAESIDRHEKKVRDISTLTLALRATDLPAIRERAEAFRRELMEMAVICPDPDAVYQVVVQIFPAALEGQEVPRA